MLRIRDIKIGILEDESKIYEEIFKKYKIKKNMIKRHVIVKKGIDSRKKSNVFYTYTIDIMLDNEYDYIDQKGITLVEPYEYEIDKVNSKIRPIIIGTGPAGLLAGLILAESGLNPILIERGCDVDTRKKDIENFWENRELDLNSNVQFGAGGAGTFSDGKLTTGINNPRKLKLIEELIEAGAPDEIRYAAKPHIGTDILIDVVRNIDMKIKKLGGEIFYKTKFIDYQTKNNKITSIVVEDKEGQKKIDCKYLILAIGHSARDTFYMLHDKKMEMKPKQFSVGVRVEHLQSELNEIQYGDFQKYLDSASYKVNTKTKDGRGVYTFCMSPGGVVVGASSEKNSVTTNGMSYFARNEMNSNSALLVSVAPEDYNGYENVLGGIELQRKLEKKAFELGGSNYNAPVQKVEDFLNKKTTQKLGRIVPSYKPGYTFADLNDLFPSYISESLKDSLRKLEEVFPLFEEKDAILTGVESRSSSPITIVRDEKLMTDTYGIYPCGEGAGYAGGIVSAGIDGIRCAEYLMNEIKKENEE